MNLHTLNAIGLAKLNERLIIFNFEENARDHNITQAIYQRSIA